MIDPLDVPCFAIVGHPNEGKSSVVSTLAEDDQVRISEVPGETVATRAYPVRVNDREIIRFLDTPGFQHPHRMLDWMRKHVEPSRNLALEFLENHFQSTEFVQDLELLRPLADGSGVIYVVDTSRPVRPHDLAEMEILRLTGNPRMAVLNPKENEPAFLADWHSACARCFNSTRIFNAVRATFAERIALLESLKGIHQPWEGALADAIRAFQEDWEHRIRRVIIVISEFLRDAMTHSCRRNVFDPAGEDQARIELVAEYQESIRRIEGSAQVEICRLYKHNIFQPKLEDHSILREDLFTEKTWQWLGLNRRQVAAAAAVLGAGAGIKLDLVFGHLTFGLFTLSGAALAAAAAWFRGENMARARVQKLRLGGVQIVVGPNRNPQFPFVLLDRLLLFYRLTINWAHARREEPIPISTGPEEAKAGLTAGWSVERRKICLRYLRSISRSNRQKQEHAASEFTEMIRAVLRELSDAN